MKYYLLSLIFDEYNLCPIIVVTFRSMMGIVKSIWQVCANVHTMNWKVLRPNKKEIKFFLILLNFCGGNLKNDASSVLNGRIDMWNSTELMLGPHDPPLNLWYASHWLCDMLSLNLLYVPTPESMICLPNLWYRASTLLHVKFHKVAFIENIWNQPFWGPQAIYPQTGGSRVVCASPGIA